MGLGIVSFLFSPNYAYAEHSGGVKMGVVEVTQQTKKISGTVLDESGEPVIGATVMEKGSSSNGIITDLDGHFTLTVPKGASIQISYVGYITQEIAVGNQPTIKIVLKEDSKTLDEVVVVGFGSQKKENLTGAVSQVKMEDVLGSRPITDAMSALQGTMPGLQISGGSDPGTSKTFNIRGTTSLNGGSPLVLIDNVPGDIDMVNPEDIESVSILKDAASSAIYGARAAFGVILVTTKKGKTGEKFHINYNNNFGFQNSINNPDIADGLQFLQAYKDAQFSADSYWTGQNIDKWMQYLIAYRQDRSQFDIYGDGVYKDPEDGLNYYLNEKNPYTGMFENFGFQHTHNVSLSGGTDKVSYRMSLGYSDQQGILKTDKDYYTRVTSSAFVQAEITSWLTQSVDVRYSRSKKNNPVTSDKETLYDMRLPSIYPQGTLITNDGQELLTKAPANLLAMATDNHTDYDNTRITSKTTLKPVKGLEVALEYTYDKKSSTNTINRAVTPYTTIELATVYTADQSSYSQKRGSTGYNAINAYATYSKSWNEIHNLKAMVGFNQESSTFSSLYGYAYDLINDQLPSFNIAVGESKTITDEFSQYRVRGGFYRLNYDYKGIYLFEANGRYDGSSKFPKDKRFGFFPSFSLGWNIAREDFMKETAGKWLDELKIRASWGQIGNQAINPYQYIPQMTTGKPNWTVNGEKPITLNAPGLASDDFTWETVQTLDFGFDIGVLNNRLRGTFDWYQRDTKDMLAPGVEFPAVVGATAPTRNVADLRTKGWEINVSWRDRIGQFGYNVGFNLYDSKTIITKYDNESKVLDKWYKGRQVGDIWGYVTDGYYTVDDFVDTNTWKLKEGITTINGTNPRPGDSKFKNLRDDENSVNRIDNGANTADNPGDMKIIGNDALRLQYGISLGANYKGFDLNILLQGVGKRDVWLSDARRWPFAAGQHGQIFADQLDYWQPTDPDNGDWTPKNPNPEFFRIYGQKENAGSNTRKQTKYLLNGAYLRVKNITLSYSFPKTWMQRIQLSSLKAFVSCENLHTFHHLPDGYDPERLSWGYPFYRTISFGINVTL